MWPVTTSSSCDWLRLLRLFLRLLLLVILRRLSFSQLLILLILFWFLIKISSCSRD